MGSEIKHLNDLLDGALKEKEEAELKIEKAIKYIEKNISIYTFRKDLLDILQDKEDEE